MEFKTPCEIVVKPPTDKDKCIIIITCDDAHIIIRDLQRINLFEYTTYCHLISKLTHLKKLMDKFVVNKLTVETYIDLLGQYLEGLKTKSKNTNFNSELSDLQKELKTFDSKKCAQHISVYTLQLRFKSKQITGLYKSSSEKRYIPITIIDINYYNTNINFKKNFYTTPIKQTSLYNLCIVSKDNFMKLQNQGNLGIPDSIPLDNEC